MICRKCNFPMAREYTLDKDGQLKKLIRLFCNQEDCK